MWLMADVSGTNMVNAVCAVTPVHGLSAQPTLGQVVLSGMWHPETLAIQPPTTHALPGAAGVISLRMSPRVGQAMVIVRNASGGAQIGRLELHDYAGSTFVPLGTIVNPGPFVFTRSGRLVGLEQGNRLIYGDIGGSSLQRLAQVTLARPPVAIAADDGAGQAVLLLPAIPGGAVAAVQRVDDATLALHAPESLPAGVVVNADSSIAIDPVSGAMFIANSAPGGGGGSGPLWKVTRQGLTGPLVAAAILNPLVVEPRAIQTTHRGTLVFESQGVCRALRFDDALQQWVADTDHPLTGQSIGPIFDLASSRIVPDSLDPDGVIENLLSPDSGPAIPDCIADFDASGATNVPDIFAFLSAWFASDRVADLDLDADTDVPDLFVFLAAWFAGCG